MWRWLLTGFAGLLIVIGLAAWWLRMDLGTRYYGSPGPKTFVEIPRGAGIMHIAALLGEAGVLRHRLPFVVYLRWAGKSRSLKAGEYLFTSPATPVEITQRLERGDIYYHTITIPEGLTARETIALIAQSGLCKLEDLEKALAHSDWIGDLSPEARDLEGYLFPETYRVPRRITAEQLLKTMVDRFREVLLHLKAQHPLPQGWTPHRIVTLASMIEKEVKLDAERELVASVLTNRLRKGIPLACDPTIIYALKLSGKYDGNIRKRDLKIDSPYNTYVRTGLPPGPIANPGEESLKAALAPAPTDFLYFVARNDGSHQFSKDFETHERAVFRFQKSSH